MAYEVWKPPERRIVGFNAGIDGLSGNRTFRMDCAHVFALPRGAKT
jgi:hypothetical protein